MDINWRQTYNVQHGSFSASRFSSDHQLDSKSHFWTYETPIIDSERQEPQSVPRLRRWSRFSRIVLESSEGDRVHDWKFCQSIQLLWSSHRNQKSIQPFITLSDSKTDRRWYRSITCWESKLRSQQNWLSKSNRSSFSRSSRSIQHGRLQHDDFSANKSKPGAKNRRQQGRSLQIRCRFK
jgi:hypothetical protein